MVEETYAGIRETEDVHFVGLELIGLDLFGTSTAAPCTCNADSSTDGQARGSRQQTLASDRSRNTNVVEYQWISPFSQLWRNDSL